MEKALDTAIARRLDKSELVSLGEILKKELNERSLTAKGFARLCGVSELTVFNVIHAKHEPSMRTLAKMNNWLRKH